MAHTLQLRETHKYRAGWSGLDAWAVIGSYTVERRYTEELPDDADQDDLPGTLLMVEVTLNAEQAFTEDQVRQALRDSLSASGCTHDWDCCGCISSWATATHVKDKKWHVSIGYTRNI